MTAAIVYVNCPPPHRLLDWPVITAVVVGFLLTVNERTALCPHVLTARTVRDPLTNAEA